MIKEYCSGNLSGIPEAVEAGIRRIELCDRLDVGGTTPETAVLKKAVQYAHEHEVELVCMIRPRGGDFVYSDSEKEIMKASAQAALSNGADGIVFGALTADNKVDWSFIEELVALAENRQTVFHMAIDFLSESDQLDTVEGLIERKMTRILTRGAPSGSAVDNAEHINALIEVAAGRIEVLAGGGITHQTLQAAADAIHTDQFHGTKIVEI